MAGPGHGPDACGDRRLDRQACGTAGASERPMRDRETASGCIAGSGQILPLPRRATISSWPTSSPRGHGAGASRPRPVTQWPTMRSATARRRSLPWCGPRTIAVLGQRAGSAWSRSERRHVLRHAPAGLPAPQERPGHLRAHPETHRTVIADRPLTGPPGGDPAPTTTTRARRRYPHRKVPTDRLVLLRSDAGLLATPGGRRADDPGLAYVLALRPAGDMLDRADFLDRWRCLIAEAVVRLPPQSRAPEGPNGCSAQSQRRGVDAQEAAMLILAAIHGVNTLSQVAQDPFPLNAPLDLALGPFVGHGGHGPGDDEETG
jgi:hypothetical protein